MISVRIGAITKISEMSYTIPLPSHAAFVERMTDLNNRENSSHHKSDDRWHLFITCQKYQGYDRSHLTFSNRQMPLSSLSHVRSHILPWTLRSIHVESQHIHAGSARVGSDPSGTVQDTVFCWSLLETQHIACHAVQDDQGALRTGGDALQTHLLVQ